MPAKDEFYGGGRDDITSPFTGAVAVTPNDSNDLQVMTRGLYIGVGGSLVVMMGNGATVTFAGLVAGTLLPARVVRVLATGTTASSIVAVW